MTKVRLQHKGKPVSIDVDADGDKVRNHTPLRFRVGYGVSVDTGVNTWFMSRDQLDYLSNEVLTEILQTKGPGSDKVLENAEARTSEGQMVLVRSLRSIGHLTHPDVLMLIDMRQNPNHYVNGASTFAGAFRALSRKVMDLSFCATEGAEARRRDFIKMTGAVTRGMDQFIYCRPNASAASPYVNFSVIPASENYEDVRFPTHYDKNTETKEKIPKTRFREVYCFYVNELFDLYRRYLRLLGSSNVEAGNEAEVNPGVLLAAPGDSTGEGGDGASAVLAGIDAEQMASAQANIDAQNRAEQQRQIEAEAEQERVGRKQAKKAKKMSEREEIISTAVTEALKEFRSKVRQERASRQKNEPLPEEAPAARSPEYEPEDKPMQPSLSISRLDVAAAALEGNKARYTSPSSWSSAIKKWRQKEGLSATDSPTYEEIKKALIGRNVNYIV